MNTTSTTNVTMSLTEQNNAIISEALDGIIAEAVSHFNQKRTRHMPDDERYFFKKAEVDAVLSKLLHQNGLPSKLNMRLTESRHSVILWIMELYFLQLVIVPLVVENLQIFKGGLLYVLGHIFRWKF